MNPYAVLIVLLLAVGVPLVLSPLAKQVRAFLAQFGRAG